MPDTLLIQKRAVPHEAPPSLVSAEGLLRTGERTLWRSRELTSRVLPFALFMAFIALDEMVRLTTAAGLTSIPLPALPYLYPLKAFSVALLLYLFRREYRELTLAELTVGKKWVVSSLVGAATCVLWVALDWTLPGTAPPAGFNPLLFPAGPLRALLIVCRVAGAVLVVPVMEELFWRSFLPRYLIAPHFHSVPLGRFTPPSFLITTLLFGLEHHLLFAGMAAGAIYNALLLRTRSLAHCVLAHAVTNLALACYVLFTGNWQFW